MLEQGLELKELVDPQKDHLATTQYCIIADKQYVHTDKLLGADILLNQSAIMDGVSFMKPLLDQLEWQRNTMLKGIDGGSVVDKD